MNRNQSGIRIENSGLGAGLGLGFLVADASVGSARTQAAGAGEPRLQITARVYNYAAVSRGTLLGAETRNRSHRDEAARGILGPSEMSKRRF
jgi:hypothetical protein